RRTNPPNPEKLRRRLADKARPAPEQCSAERRNVSVLAGHPLIRKSAPHYGEATMKFLLKNIRSNPFRDLAKFPIQREKIAALRESIRATGYWGNISARRVDGGAEIAFGHHRIEALRQEFGAEHEVDLIIEEIPDERILAMLARE